MCVYVLTQVGMHMCMPFVYGYLWRADEGAEFLGAGVTGDVGYLDGC